MDFGGLCGPKPDLLIKKSLHADLAALRGPEFVTLVLKAVILLNMMKCAQAKLYQQELSRTILHLVISLLGRIKWRYSSVCIQSGKFSIY